MEERDYEKFIEKSYRVFETGNVNELDQYYTTDAIEHTPDNSIQGVKTGLSYFEEQLRTYTTAFPNGKFEIKEIFVKGDKAIAYATFKGKNTGEFYGSPATNKEVTMDVCEMFKFKNGKISEHWGIWDNLSFMTQLGLISEEELQSKMEHH